MRSSDLRISISTPVFRLSRRMRLYSSQNFSAYEQSRLSSSMYSRFNLPIYASCHPAILSRNSIQSRFDSQLFCIISPPQLNYPSAKQISLQIVGNRFGNPPDIFTRCIDKHIVVFTCPPFLSAEIVVISCPSFIYRTNIPLYFGIG